MKNFNWSSSTQYIACCVWTHLSIFFPLLLTTESVLGSVTRRDLPNLSLKQFPALKFPMYSPESSNPDLIDYGIDEILNLINDSLDTLSVIPFGHSIGYGLRSTF